MDVIEHRNNHACVYVYMYTHTKPRTLKCRVPTSVLCAFPGTRASAEPQSTSLLRVSYCCRLGMYMHTLKKLIVCLD